MAQDDPIVTLRQLNALGQLSSGVGHHVINAFAAIVSNAEILRQTAQMTGAVPVDPVAIADLIIKTAVDASGVARRLIDYSRTATVTGPDLVAPDQLIREVVEAGQASGRPEIEWVAALAPAPPIRGDAMQLHQMLDHLIANALEAMPPTGGTITLATGKDERGWVVIEVRDSGCGLVPQVQERAVEPFFTTKPGHLGVGLSIANGIWRRHRGTLSIRGHAGEGARVRLCVEPGRAADRRPTPPPLGSTP
ncbi:MAG: HAMP domain-containing sensor histidine kinase [Isosphaeraceae bacterium]